MPVCGSVQDNEGRPALGPRGHGRLRGSLRRLRATHYGSACLRAACRGGGGPRGVFLRVRLGAGRRHDGGVGMAGLPWPSAQ
eukprot:7371693-Alexandrium_andersonii.AAC.1